MPKPNPGGLSPPRSPTIIALIALMAGLLHPPILAADAMKCGTRLVTTGDNKAEVLARCGSPDWRDQWSESVIEDYAGSLERRISFERERWIYNFGPQKFLRFLLFENGRLVKISTGDHGFHRDRHRTGQCDMDALSNGLSQYEILHRCGEPFFRDSRAEEELSVIAGQNRRLEERRVDEWTYNLGPTRFMRILTFKNGRLTDIATGDKGF